MNYVYATVSYQDGRNIKYADSLGIGRTMGEAEKNLKDTLFKYNPKAKPYYNDIYDAQSHHQNYDFELEDVFTELRGLDKHPELMQILLDYLPRAITQRLPGVKVVSDATMETTPNGFKVSVGLMDKNGNKFTLDAGYGGNPGIHVSIFSKEDNRYVSDTAKGYPPRCPDIKKLLDQYYKHLNNESLINKRRQPMKRYECSMQKRKESFCSKKNEMKVTPEVEALFAKGENGYSQIYDDLCNTCENTTADVLQYEEAEEPSRWVSADLMFGESEYEVLVYDYGENEISYSIKDEYGNNLKDYISAYRGAPLGKQKGYTPDKIDDMWLDLKDDLNELRSDNEDESKKSEAENPKDVIGDELPYGMMQYRDEETKEWLPILVSINYNDRGWFYEGLAPSDNFGNFSFEEFNRGFLKTCKSGTDKCDQELVNSMKKFFTESSMDIDKMPTKEVTNLTAYIPKGKPYIGKE